MELGPSCSFSAPILASSVTVNNDFICNSKQEYDYWIEENREELLEEILDLIRDSGYIYRVSE